jgi:hypothetical protein
MPANTLSAEAQKLVDTLSELTESNRRTLENLRAYRGDSIQQMYEMVAGIQPCAPIRLTETQCIACEGVPSRKCPDCGDPLCSDCWADHNHGREVRA